MCFPLGTVQEGSYMLTALLYMNLIVSAVSALAGVIALIRPAAWSASNHVERGEMFYARMYAARAIPFGVIAGILPFLATWPTVAWVIFTAAVIQIADVVIALSKKDLRMTIGASFAAAVYILCGFAIR
jgi:hypothetical protein